MFALQGSALKVQLLLQTHSMVTVADGSDQKQLSLKTGAVFLRPGCTDLSLTLLVIVTSEFSASQGGWYLCKNVKLRKNCP